MGQSIITQYHPTTRTKPQRMSATTTSGIRRYFSLTHATNDAETHRACALALATELGWSRRAYHGGAYNDQGAMIWVGVTGREEDTFATPREVISNRASFED